VKVTMKVVMVLVLSVVVLLSCSRHVRKEEVIETDTLGGTRTERVSIDGRTVETLKQEWEGEYVTASGSAPVVSKHNDPARDKELARRGAILDAKRNLADKIGETRISETVTMSDLAVTDFVQSQLDAVLENVEITSEEYDEASGLYRASVRMPKASMLKIVEEYSTGP
jgi:hypothetical protein